jgi:hypothetical protein
MAEPETTRGQLDRVQREFTRWREQHGGRGHPIPAELWKAAAQVAAIQGVKATARALGVDRGRLARRVVASPCEASGMTRSPGAGLASAAFVEVDAQRVFARGKAVIRLRSRDGEQLEVEVEGGVMDVQAVARAFWERSR